MKIKIGINGMGRIGRMIVRSIIENKYSNIEIKHINNRTGTETCSNLLKYDSTKSPIWTKIEKIIEEITKYKMSVFLE